MEKAGTFSRDEAGAIYSRRMVRDSHISEVRRQAGEASFRARSGKNFVEQIVEQNGSKSSANVQQGVDGLFNFCSTKIYEEHEEHEEPKKEEKVTSNFLDPNDALKVGGKSPDEWANHWCSRHPRNGGYVQVMQWILRQVESQPVEHAASKLLQVDECHAAWCASDKWKVDVDFVPGLPKWLEDRCYLRMPPVNGSPPPPRGGKAPPKLGSKQEVDAFVSLVKINRPGKERSHASNGRCRANLYRVLGIAA
jgi:hypothetical protein